MNHSSEPSAGSLNEQHNYNNSVFNEKELETKIKRAIKEFDMLAEGDKVIVGLSGGADSMMLMHYLKYKLHIEVIACHINHNLRGEESDRDMQFAEQICKQWEIPFVVHTVDVTNYAQKNGLTLEQAGRNLRYSIFEQAAREHEAQKVATAHTLSDNAETMLLNLTRGTGLKGLCGIPPKRDNIIRPLIHLTRQEVEAYCQEFSIEYVTDSTNLKTIYTRNKVRHLIMPELKIVNPQIYSSINKTIQVLLHEQDYMKNVSEEAYSNVNKADGLVVDDLMEYHIAIRHRVIAMFLEQNQIDRSNDLIEKLDKMMKIGKGKINVKGETFIEIKKNVLILNDNRLIVDYFELPLEFGDFLTPNGKRYTISICNQDEIKTIKNVYKKLLYIGLDYDKIIGKPVLRQRKIGDKISLENREGTKTLKKLFIDDKLTAAQKSQRIVLADEKSVIAVEGYGCDRRVQIDEKTTRILLILTSSEATS